MVYIHASVQGAPNHIYINYTMTAPPQHPSTIDPADDPFSPSFQGPFQGIPTRILPEDTLTYQVYELSWITNAAKTRSSLEVIRKETLCIAKEWGKDYVWQRTPFNIEFSEEAIQQSQLQLHLTGTIEYGDAIDDEWFAVSILLETSRRHPQAWFRVHDNDGEFLLIEAAHALPRWLNPEVATHRVWIRQGRIYIIPLSTPKKRELSLHEALDVLTSCKPEALLRDKMVEQEALVRTMGYPAAAIASVHRSMIVLPRRVAAVLRWRPEAIAAAVEAFYVRDPISLGVVKKAKVFPWTDTIEIQVRFSKVLFAQVKGQIWDPPLESRYPHGREVGAKVDIGRKITAGLEMAVARENAFLWASNSGRSALIEDLREALEKGTIDIPNDEDVGMWEKVDDGEEWLDIDFTKFEKGLKGTRAAGRTTGDSKEGEVEAYGDLEQGEKMKRMVERFEKFLNDDTAGLGGAEFEDEMDEDDEDDEDDIDAGEDKAISFDEDEFSMMMREMMGLPPDGPLDSDQLISSQSSPSHEDLDAVGKKLGEDKAKEEREIKHIQDQIELELTEAGVIERDVPKITEVKEDEDEEESGNAAGEQQGAINIDYTLAKNLLESFKGQAGDRKSVV